ncbi:CHAT domain-containing protein [Nocardioides speluncae]|uniref:CHAT domain-containing protein n=1 Tax=Nocardioides speluncae TaxID=2670337 RepID=UPI000D68A09D|nr:CHAT domain-containing tetratricopeptide repeat protein [Nocardioides speluncae]
MSSAEELHERGVAALTAGRHAQARQLLNRALKLAADDNLIARIESSLAYVEAETGDRQRALEICDNALLRANLTDETAGLLHSQRALLLMRAGESVDALAAFSRAIPLLQGVHGHLARAHMNRGNVYLQQNALGQAEADFRAAAQNFKMDSLKVEAAMSEHNLGYVQLLRGDLVGALRSMDAARPSLAPLSRVSEATCDQDRAEVLLAAGLVAEGRQALRDAARAYGSRGLHQHRGEAELTLARTLLHTDTKAALAAARGARKRFVRTGTDAWRVRADGVALAAEVELGRKGPSLLTRGETLIEELTEQGLYWGATSVRLHTARVMVRRSDYEGARQRLAKVRVDESAPLAVRLLARDVRADLASRLGRKQAALMHLRNGLADLHSWQSSFGSLDLQTMVAGHGTRLATRGLGLAVESRSPEILLEWSERARMLASRVQPVRTPADDEIAAGLAELRRLATPADGPRIPAPRRDAELRQQVRERAWQHRGSGEVAEPCSLEQVQNALARDTALVTYIVGNGSVVALVVTDTDTTVRDLGPRTGFERLLGGVLPDLDVAASMLPAGLARTVRGELAARLDDLSRLLVAPLLGALGDRRVVITPSGMLSGTPWTLLPGFNGRPLTVAQTATSWLARRRTPLRSRTAGFVAGPRVERARDEVSAASAIWPSAEVLSGKGATAAAVSELAQRVDVLHIAAHGRHSSENPMFSGLELVDGPWFGYDIDQLRSVPDVVLLSACEVGRSSVRYGEELIGMTSAWLHAGARCVIASPAAVSDEVAHDVLVKMHAGLGGGADPAAALAAAVPPAAADGPPAPFVCFA